MIRLQKKLTQVELSKKKFKVYFLIFLSHANNLVLHFIQYYVLLFGQ